MKWINSTKLTKKVALSYTVRHIGYNCTNFEDKQIDRCKHKMAHFTALLKERVASHAQSLNVILLSNVPFPLSRNITFHFDWLKQVKSHLKKKHQIPENPFRFWFLCNTVTYQIGCNMSHYLLIRHRQTQHRMLSMLVICFGCEKASIQRLNKDQNRWQVLKTHSSKCLTGTTNESYATVLFCLTPTVLTVS